MTEQTTNQDETVDAEAADAGASDPDPADAQAPAGEAGADEGSQEGGNPTAGAREEEGASADTDEAEAGGDAGGEPVGTVSRGDDAGGLDDLQSEYDTLNDRHLRLVAEFNNFRRRSEQERMSAWTRAQADLVGKLLDVLDDLQRVADLDLSNASVEAIMEGIDLVERKFLRQLQEAGVEMVDPAGQAFDPERMEAMMRVPAETDEQVDTVAQVFQKGYSLKGTLVRPARVSVYTQG